MTERSHLQESAPRLWCCHEHKMIGNQQEGHGHQQAHGCEVVELSQETSDAVRAEWAKEATFWDPALALTLLRARNVREADSPSSNPGGPFGV